MVKELSNYIYLYTQISTMNSPIEDRFKTEEACMEYLAEVRWGGLVTSPFSATSKVYKCSGDKYKCKETGKYFTARTNTIFHNSKVPLSKWFRAIWLMQHRPQGMTSVALATELGTTQKTAWLILRRLKRTGIIEYGLGTSRKPENIEVSAESNKLSLTEWLKILQK